MNVKVHSLKFIKLFKYASSLVPNTSVEMCPYVTDVSKELEKEFHASILHENMDIFRFMVHAQQVEEIHVKKRNREAKKEKYFESGSSKSRLDIQDKPMFKKRFSNQVPSNFSKNRKSRGSNPKP